MDNFKLFLLGLSQKKFIYSSFSFVCFHFYIYILDVTLQEKNLQENWKESWNALEDGNEWMGLNNRRKYLRIFKIHEIEYENSLVEYYAEKLKLKEAIIVAERIADEVVINKVSFLHGYL